MATGYQHNQQQQQQQQQQYIPSPQQYQQYAQQAQQYQQQMQMQQYAQNTQQYQQYAAQTSHALHGAVSNANGLLQPGRPKGAVGKKGKKAKDPNRPKRPTSAYFFFIASKREEAKLRGQHISKVAEWTKQVSALWREMPAEDKKKFDKQAVEDKARYEREMQAYSGKRPKDENKPKRPQSAYFLFLADFRIKNKHKFTGEGAHKELIRAAGEAWNNLTAPEKRPYEILAEKEKLKYEEAMKIYNQGGGAAAKKPRTEAAAPTLPVPQQQNTIAPSSTLVQNSGYLVGQSGLGGGVVGGGGHSSGQSQHPQQQQAHHHVQHQQVQDEDDEEDDEEEEEDD